MLRIVKNDSNYNLSGDNRVELYESFKPSRLYLADSIEGKKLDYYQILKESFLTKSLADQTLYWIAILTVEKVANTPPNRSWVQSLLENSNRNQVVESIELAKALLRKRAYFDTAYQFLISPSTQNGEDIKRLVNYNAYSVYEAAHYMLDFILNARLTWTVYTPYEELLEALDFATNAVNAQSAIDNNPPGMWTTDISEGILPIEFDLQKRLGFWEWWLTEAIPQAWQLAQETQ
jgi:hypothetical protein